MVSQESQETLTGLKNNPDKTSRQQMRISALDRRQVPEYNCDVWGMSEG